MFNDEDRAQGEVRGDVSTLVCPWHVMCLTFNLAPLACQKGKCRAQQLPQELPVPALALPLPFWAPASEPMSFAG